MMRAGYKQSITGVIPEDWEVVSLGAIGESLIGLTYRPEDVSDSGVLVLRSSNIQAGVLRFDDNVWVRVAVPEKLMIQPGDVLICARNGSRELIGKSVFISKEMAATTFGAFMAVYRSMDGHYVSHQMRSAVVRRQIHEHLGATINQITNKSLNGFMIPFPPTRKEREAIAEALSDADALVDSLHALIAKKRNMKQAAMQQLLTGRTRLPGFTDEWHEIRLGDCGTFSKGQGIKKDEVLESGLPCIRYGQIYTDHNDWIRSFTAYISSSTAQASRRLVHGDLLFTGSGETAVEIGKCVAFLGDEEAYAGGDIVIFAPRDLDSKFMGYILNGPSAVQQKTRLAQGDAVVHISAASLASLQVWVPSRIEQQAIAEVLSEMDAEIDALVTQREKAELVKQGMMQELLSGRVRLV